MSASYAYISPNDPKKDQKNYRDSDGKVIVQQPNVQTSLPSKINYNRNKEFKYLECPAQKKTAESADNNQEPFKTGTSHADAFLNSKQTYFDSDLKKKDLKSPTARMASHEGAFKPTCISKAETFTSVKYVEEGQGREKVVKAENKENKGEPFK